MKNWSYNTYQTCVFVGMKTVYILKVEIKRTKTKIKAGPKNVGFWLKHVLCRLVLSLCSNVTVLAGILFLLHPPGLHRSYLLKKSCRSSFYFNFKEDFFCSEFLSYSKKKSPRKYYSCYQIVYVRLTLQGWLTYMRLHLAINLGELQLWLHKNEENHLRVWKWDIEPFPSIFFLFC